MEKTITDQIRIEYDVCCSRCSCRAVASMRASGIGETYREPTARMVAGRVVCSACGAILESDGVNGVPFQLWFKSNFRGHIIWFNNEEHGEHLLSWLEGKRERLSFPWYDHIWLETLPKWMIAGKNRDAITKEIRRMLETAREQV